VAGFLRFAALFIPVYVAWQGYMAYADRFDTDDLAFRAAYFAAMLAIAAMAVPGAPFPRPARWSASTEWGTAWALPSGWRRSRSPRPTATSCGESPRCSS
jgi:hypothetical protein